MNMKLKKGYSLVWGRTQGPRILRRRHDCAGFSCP